MEALNGYAGEILKVDLSSRRTSTVPTEGYRRFVGGRGLAARLYWEEVPPEAGAFNQQNRLIFATGPLAGIPVIGGSRWGAYAKTPLRSPETFNYANLGGRWGADLKFAGYDGLVVHGTAEKPVYLVIQDGRVEFKDASHLWGMGAAQAREAIKKEWGDLRVVAVGPAGENLVVPASLLADNDASGSAGLGSVMGSKKLKAICVRASGRKTSVAHPEALKKLTDYLRSLDRGTFTAWGTDFVSLGSKARKDPCFGCQGKCMRIKYTTDDGRTGKFACQSSLFYQQWVWRLYGQQNNDVAFHATRLCDDYGIDTWFMEQTLAWLYRCHRAGLPIEEKLGMSMSKLGSPEFMDNLTRSIAMREGIGELLAGGLMRAAGSLGEQWASLVKHPDPYEPRLYLTTAMIWAVEPREPIQALHEVGYPLAQWTTGIKGTDKTHVTSEVVKGIARRFWGGEAAADFTTTEGKAVAARMIQDRQYAKESLILCDWIYPVSDNKFNEDHVGDPTLESSLYSAVTGADVDEAAMYRLGERAFNQQRAAVVRDGWRGRADDRLPEDWHAEPLKKGVMDPDCLVPGKDGQPVSRVGAVVGGDEFENMKDDYYQSRGWDIASGLQKRGVMEGLGLKDVADDLERRGLLGRG